MKEEVEEKADSLIDLLTEQCADLESLLALAREESDAASQGNFAKIIDVYEERSELGERLETFQKQISELREQLDKSVPQPISNRINEMVTQTLTYDNNTKKLLTAANEKANEEMSQLKQAAENTKLYTKEKQRGLALELRV